MSEGGEIQDVLLVIGRDANGKIGMSINGNMNPAAVSVLLEQVRMSLIGQFNFNKEQRVVPATIIPNGRPN